MVVEADMPNTGDAQTDDGMSITTITGTDPSQAESTGAQEDDTTPAPGARLRAFSQLDADQKRLLAGIALVAVAYGLKMRGHI